LWLLVGVLVGIISLVAEGLVAYLQPQDMQSHQDLLLLLLLVQVDQVVQHKAIPVAMVIIRYLDLLLPLLVEAAEGGQTNQLEILADLVEVLL
jgi:hypothetical protein